MTTWRRSGWWPRMAVQACSRAATRRLAAQSTGGVTVMGWSPGLVPAWPAEPSDGRCPGGSRRPGLELGDQGAGVAGAEPSRGGQLSGADRRAVGAEFGVGTLGLSALGQHLDAVLWRSGAARRHSSAGGRLLGAGLGGGWRLVGAVQQAEHGEAAEQPHRGRAGGQIPDRVVGRRRPGAGWTGRPRRPAAQWLGASTRCLAIHPVDSCMARRSEHAPPVGPPRTDGHRTD
jgi:hypothetical protein